MMKKLSNSLLGLIFALCFSFAANAQSSWIGSYEFDEDGGKTAGGTAIFVSHRIDINETDDGLIAMITSNGYQTSKDLVGKAKAEGNKLLIYFEYYGENNTFEEYTKGDLLLTFEKKKDEILTTWGKFLPIVKKNEKSGKVYFKKLIKTNDEEQQK